MNQPTVENEGGSVAVAVAIIDRRHVTGDTQHVTHDMGYMTHDM